jgi:hypothetical protein
MEAAAAALAARSGVPMLRTTHRLALAFVLIVVGVVATFHGLRSIVELGIYGPKGAKVYYDAYHGARHLWDRDNRRHRHAYDTVSGYHRFVSSLQEMGYEVHAEDARGFDRSTLDGYDVFFIGEQNYEAHFMSEDERLALIDWVKDGGSLFAVVEHSNAYYMADVVNRLFEGLPVTARLDTITDEQQRRPRTRQWAYLKPAAGDGHPVVAGVEEYLSYAGASLDSPHGVLFSSESSWGDKYDPEKKPLHDPNGKKDSGELQGPLAGVVAFEHGEGKIILVGDHNAFSNPNLYFGDHLRFVDNAFAWLSPTRLNKDVLWGLAGVLCLLIGLVLSLRRGLRSGLAVATSAVVTGGVGFWVLWSSTREPTYDLFVHAGNQSTMNYMTKHGHGFLGLYGQWTKEPQLRPWSSRERLKPGYDALFLSAPTEPYTPEQMAIIDGYVRRGKTIVYLASIASLDSPAGLQLRERFDFEVDINRHWPLWDKVPYLVEGPEELMDGILRFYVSSRSTPVTVRSGLEPVIHLMPGGFHVEGRAWTHRSCIFDVMSEKRVGLTAKFILIAPIEMFDTHALGDLYHVGDVTKEQMAEFMIRLAKTAVGDDTPNPEAAARAGAI